MANLMIAGAVVFVAMLVALQLLTRLRARALRGKPLPDVPGALGAKLRSLEQGLIYFMSPACGACSRYTQDLSLRARRRSDVLVIDVTRNLEVARALGVMATPSAIEVRRGCVVGYHIGGIPPKVLARFA